MTRIEAIVNGIREELERRPQALEGGGLKSLYLHIFFEGERWSPRDVIVRPEFQSVGKTAKDPNRS